MYVGDNVVIKDEYRKRMKCVGETYPLGPGEIYKDFLFSIGPTPKSDEPLPVTRRQLDNEELDNLIEEFEKRGYLHGLDGADITVKHVEQAYKSWLVEGEHGKYALEYATISTDNNNKQLEAIYVSNISWHSEYVIGWPANSAWKEKSKRVYRHGFEVVDDG